MEGGAFYVGLDGEMGSVGVECAESGTDLTGLLLQVCVGQCVR